MSDLSIVNFVESGKKDLAVGNYWSALSVALMLPSMCSRIYFKDNKDYKNNNNWKDKACYVDFCNLIMCSTDIVDNLESKLVPDKYLVSILGNNYGKLLYDLRCNIFHEGLINLYDDKKIFLMAGDSPMSTELTDCRIISVKDLCETIFDYVKLWYDNFGIQNLDHSFVFNIETDKDDELLFKKLCSDDRAEYLKQKFYSEIKK